MADEKRDMSVRMALEWAFMMECAQLDLDDGKQKAPVGVDTLYRLIQNKNLGVGRIDGGGRSLPHPDAELISAAVTELGMMKGFARLSISVTEFSRLGTSPDWMPGVVGRIEPVEWRPRRGFALTKMAKTEVIRRYTTKVVTPHPKNPKHKITRRVKGQDEICPCVWVIHPDEIKQARDLYTQWVVALHWIRDRLVKADHLETINITHFLPPHRPWMASPKADSPRETKS